MAFITIAWRSAELALQFLRRAPSRGRDFFGASRVRIHAARGEARTRRLAGESALDLRQRAPGDSPCAPAGEELVEEEAELVNVRGDRDRLAADLLGARVLGGEQAKTERVAGAASHASVSRIFAIRSRGA